MVISEPLQRVDTHSEPTKKTLDQAMKHVQRYNDPRLIERNQFWCKYVFKLINSIVKTLLQVSL